jgi:hypothetical protein
MQQEAFLVRREPQELEGGGEEALPAAVNFFRGEEGQAREVGLEAGGGGLEAQVVAALNTQAGRVPEWVRLLPLGDVPLGDGREPLWVDREASQKQSAVSS